MPARTNPAPKAVRTVVGKRVANAARQVAAHLRGEISLPAFEATVPSEIDVVALRERLNLSQAAFARAFGLDVSALQAWEQHRRRPDRTARILLVVIARAPEAVLRALAAWHAQPSQEDR